LQRAIEEMKKKIEKLKLQINKSKFREDLITSNKAALEELKENSNDLLKIKESIPRLAPLKGLITGLDNFNIGLDRKFTKLLG